MPSTSISSALPAHRIYFFSTQISTPFRKLSTKNTLHSIAFLFCFNLFQISLQFFMCKPYGEMVWHEVTRRCRYNALKLSWITTKYMYVFWSPIFPPQTTKLTPDSFRARNNPRNACLCLLPPTLLSAHRVSPLNETLLQSTHRQMKWRLAHCTKASLRRLVIVWPFKGGPHWWGSCFFRRRLWIVLADNPCTSGFATEWNPVAVDTPPDEMASSALHRGKPTTSRHCLTV